MLRWLSQTAVGNCTAFSSSAERAAVCDAQVQLLRATSINFSRRFLNVKAKVRFRTIPLEICGVESDKGTVYFLPKFLVSPCQYHSTNTLYSVSPCQYHSTNTLYSVFPCQYHSTILYILFSPVNIIPPIFYILFSPVSIIPPILYILFPPDSTIPTILYILFPCQYNSNNTLYSIFPCQYHSTSTLHSVSSCQYHSTSTLYSVSSCQYHSTSTLHSVSSCQYHSTNTLHSVFLCPLILHTQIFLDNHSYQKEKRAKSVTLQTKQSSAGCRGAWSTLDRNVVLHSFSFHGSEGKLIINILYGRACREVKGSWLEIGIRKRAEWKRKAEGLQKGSYQWAVIWLPTCSANDPTSARSHYILMGRIIVRRELTEIAAWQQTVPSPWESGILAITDTRITDVG